MKALYSRRTVTLVTMFVISGFEKVLGDESPCQLPVDSGTCSSTETNSTSGKEEQRYYYSYANFKCTEFPYSGCGGNPNNFKSLEECKRKCNKSLGGDLPLIANILAAQAQQKCYYGNRTYAVREAIPEATVDSPCSMSCFCASYRPGTSPTITCAEVDCPPYPEGDDCVPIDKTGTACCSDYYCPSMAPAEESKPFTCTYKGKQYVEGQTIDPDDYPCIACSCNKNWTGVLTTKNGVCKEVNCGITIHNQQKLVNRCTPKFYTTSAGHQSCCPIEWNCQNKEKMTQNRNSTATSA
ncbi:uncharacterized protein ZC84.1 [Folsomia candida]|uniref:Kunitz-type serine protease inhibitor superbin-3 n=1 Tax=Folsomia candida TaxID=158441 RepID=A0A226CXY6_FOLCA|nr:uncharacterized protein ZC84.1 [Folsomia candida]OXA37291.1 Kunitz-type serine protease inhibitor superbin-3 [Folsomia candida]